MSLTFITLLAIVATAAGQAQPIPPPDRFLYFLQNNRFPNGLPLSYDVKPFYDGFPTYWDNITKDDKPHDYHNDTLVPQCGSPSPPISSKAMNAYEFETEQLITALGLDIYDGAVWCMAMTLLGQTADCKAYLDTTMAQHKTMMFPDIRGDATCMGIMSTGECSDPGQTGACGFCYGDNPTNRSLDSDHALFFRMICDIWDVGATVDLRCPDQNMTWKWNSYNPVLGENAWAILISPMSYLYNASNGTLANIPDDATELTLAVNFVNGALALLKAGNTGGFYYGPHNMWSIDGSDLGYIISVENQASLLAGLKMFREVIKAKPSNPTLQGVLPTVEGYITGLNKFILGAYNTTLGYFVQGASYNASTSTLRYFYDADFATDCQTWGSSVLGQELIDATYGPGTTFNLWGTLKNTAGYQMQYGMIKGVGYTANSYADLMVFSGEWTFGAMNWLRIMINNSTLSDDIKANMAIEINYMRQCIESQLVVKYPVQKGTDAHHSTLYANQRYWIPFGWYANAIPALASTAWTVFFDVGFNPLMMDGSYRSNY